MACFSGRLPFLLSFSRATVITQRWQKVTEVLTEYIRAAMERAEYEPLEDGTQYGHIPELQGVLANAPTLEMCRTQLREVLEDWIVLGLRLGHPLPVVDGIDLNGIPAS